MTAAHRGLKFIDSKIAAQFGLRAWTPDLLIEIKMMPDDSKEENVCQGQGCIILISLLFKMSLGFPFDLLHQDSVFGGRFAAGSF